MILEEHILEPSEAFTADIEVYNLEYTFNIQLWSLEREIRTFSTEIFHWRTPVSWNFT